MKKLMNLILVMVAITFVFFCSPSAKAYSNSDTVQAEMQYNQSDARQMLDFLNDFRANGDDSLGKPWYWNSNNISKTYPNLQKLTYDYTLEAIAMQRAAEAAISFSHTRPNNTAWNTVTGFNQYYSRAENLAAGPHNAEAAFYEFAEHDYPYSYQGHRRNLLGNYSAVGIGHVYYNGIHYWAVEFGNPARNTTFTPANDGLTVVSIDIVGGSFSVSCDTSSVSIELGSSQDLPHVNTTVLTSDTWPGFPCPVLGGEWRVENTSVAAISDGKLVAKSAGSTRLIGTAYGKVIEIPVEVTCSYTVTAELSVSCYCYTGSEIHPVPVVSDVFGNILKKDSDYTIQYIGNCTEIGTYTIIVNGKGSYSFQHELEFEIVRAMRLPSIISTIESEAFSGLNVSMIIVPAGIDVIEAGAFANCSNLRVLVFESNPFEISDSIISGCGDVTIRVTKGGAAEQWALSMGYSVEYL